MYPRTPWELVTDPWGFAKHTLGTTDLDNYDLWGIYQPPEKSAVAENHSYHLWLCDDNKWRIPLCQEIFQDPAPFSSDDDLRESWKRLANTLQEEKTSEEKLPPTEWNAFLHSLSAFRAAQKLQLGHPYEDALTLERQWQCPWPNNRRAPVRRHISPTQHSVSPSCRELTACWTGYPRDVSG